MRVLIWASSLQTNLLALALELAERRTPLLVVAKDLDAFRREPIAQRIRLPATTIDRADPALGDQVQQFDADIVVFDHYPPEPLAPRACLVPHGPGWKARSRHEVRKLHRRIVQLTGRPPSRSNFVVPCYGEADRRWRIERWGLPLASCPIAGLPFADLLTNPPYDRGDLARFYSIPLLERPTVLLNITWHYGRLFPNTWSAGGARASQDADLSLLTRLFARTEALRANVLVCLHDEERYPRRYLRAIRELSNRHSHVQLKHRDQHADNLADLVVADVMISNLSSFVPYFYFTGRPSIHLCPPRDDRDDVVMAHLAFGRRLVVPRTWSAEPAWMRAPEDNGGLSVYDGSQLEAALERALEEPGCCRERSRQWLERHIDRGNGRSGARLADALEEMML